MEMQELTLYPTIIHKVKIPEMIPYNSQIVEIVQQLAVAGDTGSNEMRLGRHVAYQTKPVLFDRQEECFARLKQYHKTALRDYLQTDSGYCASFKNKGVPDNVTVCWAYIQNEKQISSYVHHHGSFGVNAIYYAKVPELLIENEGHICFADPRGAGISSLLGSPLPSENSFHKPEEGMMILFPSWLQHRPHPMPNSYGLRVSLGIDTNFQFHLGAGFTVTI